MWIFSALLVLLPLTKYKFAIFNLFMHSSKSIWPVGLKGLQECWSARVLYYLCILGFACGFIQCL
jgi:hypothetical protein